MKNLLSIFVFLIYFIGNAQELRTISFTNFGADSIQNSFLNEKNKANFIKFKEIAPVDIIVVNNNSEGKFLVSEPKNSVIKKNFIKENFTEYTKNNSLTTEMKKEFIYNVIVRELLEMKRENITKIDLNGEYGDQNIDVYRNYDAIMNQLIKTIELTDEVEIQIGKSVYPFLNKLYKSELDKTLNHSLNLVAINF